MLRTYGAETNAGPPKIHRPAVTSGQPAHAHDSSFGRLDENEDENLLIQQGQLCW